MSEIDPPILATIADIDVHPDQKTPQRRPSKWAIARANIVVEVPLIADDGRDMGPQRLEFDMAEIPEGDFKSSVAQLIVRMLEDARLVQSKETP